MSNKSNKKSKAKAVQHEHPVTAHQQVHETCSEVKALEAAMRDHLTVAEWGVSELSKHLEAGSMVRWALVDCLEVHVQQVVAALWEMKSISHQLAHHFSDLQMEEILHETAETTAEYLEADQQPPDAQAKVAPASGPRRRDGGSLMSIVEEEMEGLIALSTPLPRFIDQRRLVHVVVPTADRASVSALADIP